MLEHVQEDNFLLCFVPRYSLIHILALNCLSVLTVLIGTDSEAVRVEIYSGGFNIKGSEVIVTGTSYNSPEESWVIG